MNVRTALGECSEALDDEPGLNGRDRKLPKAQPQVAQLSFLRARGQFRGLVELREDCACASGEA